MAIGIQMKQISIEKSAVSVCVIAVPTYPPASKIRPKRAEPIPLPYFPAETTSTID